MNNLDPSTIQYRLLKLLIQNADMTQRQMAKEMGISLGKLNYCVTELSKKGMIKISHIRNAANLKTYAYLLTPKGITEKVNLTRRFLSKRIEEYEQIRKQIQELSMELDGEDLGGILAGIAPDDLAPAE